jgi:predicted transposase/invertase (TIGR01784 family)
MEYYGSRLYTTQDMRGIQKDFGDLKRIYQINLLAGMTMFSDEAFIHRFEFYDPGQNVSLGGRMRIYVVELVKIQEKPLGEMNRAEKWGIFFRYCADKGKRGLVNEILAEEEGITMAAKALIEISQDERERAWLESKFKYELDLQSDMVSAERRGIKQGLEQGHAEGAYEKALETARKLKQMGLSNGQIAEGTGLDLEKIESL